MRHLTVFGQQGTYAGWPANHGAWQWGDEFLVGFLRGKYKRKSMHNIAEPFEKVLARSLDGGETWSVELPGVDFEALESRGEPESSPEFDLDDPDTIVRVCGVYDHGGDACWEAGAFYLSRSRGRPGTWEGPFAFTGLEASFSGDLINTSRTRTLGNLFFLSKGQRLIWGTDDTFCARWLPDQRRFELVGSVCDDEARAVMPAVALLNDGRMVAALRRRKTAVREGWVDAFISDDAGASWRKTSRIGSTGTRNGNPPALASLPDGRLIAAFGDRDYGFMMYAISEDRGETWKSELMRNNNSVSDERDIGYPQFFVRSDGIPVCVYYWADQDRKHQGIEATVFDGEELKI